jgi:colanic acid/amylovoran biosynthesis glycosyltransferase
VIRVQHLYDKYLNTTMNWSANLLLATSTEVEHHIAAPWIVRNEYYHKQFQFHFGALQRGLAPEIDSEWTGGLTERFIRAAETKTGWWLRRLERSDVDIIHAHFGPVGVLALPLVRKTGKPLIVSFYGYDYEKALIVRPALRAAYREMFAVATKCIALGPETSRMLVAAGCPAEKIHIVPLSVPIAEIAFVPNKPRNKANYRLLQVSSFTEKKGIPDTITAFAAAHRVHPHLRLTLIGEIVEKAVHEQVMALIVSFQLSEAVTVLGFLPNHTTRLQMQEHDAFIHPSHRSSTGDTEGLPVAILEALASGLPVISTNHADIPSAVIHEQNGLLTQSHDVEALTSAILRFVDMPDMEFETYRVAARQQIKEQFEIGVAARKLMEVYGC